MKKLIILIVILLLASCKSIESEEYDYVSGISIDYKENEYVLGYEQVQMDTSGSSLIKTKVNQVKGISIPSCFSKLYSNKKSVANLSHCEVLIIGDALAKKGIEDLLNYILHDVNVRFTISMLVAKDEEAYKILESQKEEDDNASLSIIHMFDNNKNLKDVFTKMQYLEVADTYINKTSSIILPTVYLKEKELILEGACLFNEDKLYKYFSIEESNAIKLLNKELCNGEFSLDNFNVNLEEVNVKMSLNSINVSYQIEMSLYIYEANNGYDISKKEDQNKIALEFEQKMNEYIKVVLKSIQNTNLDPLKILNEYFKYDRNNYQQIENNKDLFYQSLNFDVVTSVTISTSGFAAGDLK